MLIIPAMESLRQKDCKFEASLGYIAKEKKIKARMGELCKQLCRCDTA